MEAGLCILPYYKETAIQLLQTGNSTNHLGLGSLPRWECSGLPLGLVS